MSITAGLQHTPAVRTTGSATNDHVELDFFAMELDSRDCFGQEVCKIVCTWHVDTSLKRQKALVLIRFQPFSLLLTAIHRISLAKPK